MSSSENKKEFYKQKAMIHEGFRYLFECMAHKPKNLPLTEQYEKWHCDHIKTRCKAFIINDSWGVDEERVLSSGKHTHPPMEEWDGFYGYLYEFEGYNINPEIHFNEEFGSE
jgi:hypothetical protein